MMTFPDLLNARLTVVDLQDRLLPAMAAGGEELLPRAVMLIRGMSIFDIPICVTEQYPKGLGHTVPAIATWLPDTATVIEKSAFSCFQEPEYVKLLASDPARRVQIFCGVESHVCLMQSALDAIAAGYEVIVAGDVIASRHRYDLDMAVATMRQHGVTIMGAEAILFYLMRTSRHPQFKAISNLVK